MADKIKMPEGVIAGGGTLDLIVEAKAKRLRESKLSNPIDPSTIAASTTATGDPRRSFTDRIGRKGATNIIAEIKRRSPSKGLIRTEFDPIQIARSYRRGGAAAISVLTEEDFFGGSLDYLKSISDDADVALPLLRKDFIFDEYQLYQSAVAGADAVLLIVAILSDDLLRRLIDLAKTLRLAALVEVHTADELSRAVGAGASVIGVNNRDLTTFTVDLQTSLRLAPVAPDNVTLITESGISTASDIRLLKSAGYDAFLIGEHFMRAPDPGEALALLIEASS